MSEAAQALDLSIERMAQSVQANRGMLRPMPPPTDTTTLAETIAEFELRLPGWWWSLGMCSISRDMSCGPDRSGPDADLLAITEFDEGFHHDGIGTLVETMRLVMEYAVERRELARANTGA